MCNCSSAGTAATGLRVGTLASQIQMGCVADCDTTNARLEDYMYVWKVARARSSYYSSGK